MLKSDVATELLRAIRSQMTGRYDMLVSWMRVNKLFCLDLRIIGQITPPNGGQCVYSSPELLCSFACTRKRTV